MRVCDVMAPAAPVPAETPAESLALLVRASRAPCHPVVGPDGRLLGVVSSEAGTSTVGGPAGERASASFCEVEGTRPLQELVDLFLAHRVHHAIVTSEGRAVGVVTSFDLLRVLRDRLRSESPGAPLEVAGLNGDLSDEWA